MRILISTFHPAAYAFGNHFHTDVERILEAARAHNEEITSTALDNVRRDAWGQVFEENGVGAKIFVSPSEQRFLEFDSEESLLAFQMKMFADPTYEDDHRDFYKEVFRIPLDADADLIDALTKKPV